MSPGNRHPNDLPELGVGFYTAAEAARLLKIPSRSIRRWLAGYEYRMSGAAHYSAPLWTPELSSTDANLELTFRDLIELRFVDGFLKAGLGLKAIRNCLIYAQQLANDQRPFSTRRFQTDGRTIFLESVRAHDGEPELLDLKIRQYAIKQVIERTFKDLDIEDSAVVRWRPFKGKESIVIDPKRAFGQPIATQYGVPTVVLADAANSEGSLDRVAKLFEVPVSVVRDAVNFEVALKAA